MTIIIPPQNTSNSASDHDFYNINGIPNTDINELKMSKNGFVMSGIGDGMRVIDTPLDSVKCFYDANNGGAFRAMTDTIGASNQVNTGFASTAFGTNNTANGINSVSMGTLQNVQADNVMAFGSTAMTYNTANMVGISGCKLAIDTANPTSKLHVVGLPIYSGDATAGAGGLTSGAIYTTTTGSLRVKL